MATADKPIFPAASHELTADSPISLRAKRARPARGPQPEPARPQIIFHGSVRTRVVNTMTFPYICSGELLMRFPDGNVYSGTGTLIAPNYVLTAGHNLWSAGVWAREVTYHPAINGPNPPFAPISAVQMWVPELYQRLSPPNPNADRDGNVRDYTKYIHDYGLVRLRQPLYDIGHLSPFAADDEALDGKFVQIAGYPGDQPQDTMWEAGGLLNSLAEELLFYQISTWNGQSGSSLMANFADLPEPAVPRIVGIHIAGDPGLNTNFAVRLNEDVLNEINGWMDQ